MKKGMSSSRFFVIFGSIFLVIGIIFTAVAAVVFLNRTPKEERVYTEAVISRIETYRDSDGNNNHRVYVTYEADGQKYESRLRFYSSGYREGKQIRVYYEKGQPLRVSSDFSDALLPGIFLAIGLPFTAIGGFIVFRSLSSGRNSSRVKENGIRILAAYADTKYLSDISVNGRHPYVIRSRAYDPETMQERVFESEWFWNDPEPYIQAAAIEYFPVYLDPKHPKKYYMDVSAVKTQQGE